MRVSSGSGLLEGFRLADRTTASDEGRLLWVDEIRDLGRRVTALTAVLVGEADQAGSAMRARHTRLEEWMARSGQETPREASPRSSTWATPPDSPQPHYDARSGYATAAARSPAAPPRSATATCTT